MKTDKAFSLIKNLNFNKPLQEEMNNSLDSVALMKEFLRRMLLWARYLNVEDKWPWINVAQLLKPEMKLNEDYANYLLKTKYPKWVKATVAWFLMWVEYQNLQNEKPIDLPDPYEPLILMYLNNTYFEREGNIIDLYDISSKIESFTILKKPVDTNQSFVELNLTSLLEDKGDKNATSE